MRDGAQYFTELASSAQRRYEALRATPERYVRRRGRLRSGYSTASIHRWPARRARAGLTLFAGTRPGRKARERPPARFAQRVLEPRAAGHSVTEIAAACTSEGLPVSAQTCWQILDAEGLPRLPRRDDGRRGPPAGSTRSRPPPCPAGRTRLKACRAITPGCCSCCPP